MKSISLNIEKLKDIPFNRYPKDFTFIVDGRRYQTPRIVADILSPKIRKLHCVDESINEFYINTKNPNIKLPLHDEEIQDDSENYFEIFLNLCQFENKEYEAQIRSRFMLYFYLLGNIDEYFVNQSEKLESLTVDKSIEILSQFDDYTINNSEYFDHQNIFYHKMIEVIASNFEEIDKEKLKKFSIEILEDIFRSDKLFLNDENSLFQFIFELYEQDHSYAVLFEYVAFCNISDEMFDTFVDKFDIEYLNRQIFRSICNRLSPSKCKMLDNKARYKEKLNEKEFKFQSNRYFEGIMNYLTNKTGGNIHDNKTIEITTNSTENNTPSCHPKHLVDYQQRNYYKSGNVEGIFVCFDFKDKLVQLTDYALETFDNSPNGVHIKSFVIEVSNDGKSWNEIDRQTDCSQLNNSNVKAVFSIKQNRNDFYRFVRLRQTGNSWWGITGNYYFYLYNLEFFGKISEPT
ncbi:hypothetical protein M9Y10_007322 [Tritrichomonas musculus]|uniref:F5/8 type C domain-containing protein n=1 Tax=Tritrichomonas musculus TaxID=1915356 RepID=A0ABR2J109_9EUKA